MGTEAPLGVTRAPGLGLGWTRVARQLARAIEPATVDRIWLFAPVRREEREWGTAVIACRTNDGRRRIYTASYLLIVRGREKGQGKITVEEVGDSPPAVMHEVIAGVQERAGETDPPVEIAPDLWFEDTGDEPTTES